MCFQSKYSYQFPSIVGTDMNVNETEGEGGGSIRLKFISGIIVFLVRRYFANNLIFSSSPIIVANE